jgi:hypothetical protein
MKLAFIFFGEDGTRPFKRGRCRGPGPQEDSVTALCLLLEVEASGRSREMRGPWEGRKGEEVPGCLRLWCPRGEKNNIVSNIFELWTVLFRNQSNVISLPVRQGKQWGRGCSVQFKRWSAFQTSGLISLKKVQIPKMGQFSLKEGLQSKIWAF